MKTVDPAIKAFDFLINEVAINGNIPDSLSKEQLKEIIYFLCGYEVACAGEHVEVTPEMFNILLTYQNNIVK